VQKGRLQALLATEQYQEVQPLMITTYERGIIQGQRLSVLLQLETKFGALSAAVKQRVESLTPEALRQMQVAILKAESLKELGLED
jgi:hypothetical protein